MLIHTSKSRALTRRSPGHLLEIDWRSVLTRGLVDLIDSASGVELVRGNFCTRVGLLKRLGARGEATATFAIDTASGLLGTVNSSIGTGNMSQFCFVAQSFISNTGFQYGCGSYNGAVGSGIAIEHSSAGQRWIGFDSVGVIDSGEALQAGREYFLLMTRDGTNARLYRDGMQRVTVASTNSNLSTPFNQNTLASVGIAWSSPSQIYFSGRYNRVLEHAEVRDLYDYPWAWARQRPLVFAVTAGTGTTFPYSGSGSIAFSGAATLAKLKDYPASGSLTFSGTAAVGKIKDFVASGDIVFSGAATTAYVVTGAATYPYNGSGSITLSGDATLAKIKAYLGNGSVAFSGAATTALVGVAFPAISRPESDVGGGQWTASTGTDKFAMIDEEVLDTGDYVYANATALVQRFKLAAVAAGTSPALTYVADSSTGNGIIVTLQEGTTDIASETRNPLPATPTSYTLTLTAPQIAAITDWTNLYLKIESV